MNILYSYLDPGNDTNNQGILIVGAVVALVMFAAAYSSHLAYKRRGGAEPPGQPVTGQITVGKLVVGIVVGGWILYALIVATR